MPENKVSSFGLKVFFLLSAHFTMASPLVRPDNQCISLTIWPNIPRWQRTVCCLLLSSARRNSSRWKAHYLFSIFFPFWNFYYSLQCYANFGCVAKWPSHTYADLPHIIFHHRLCQEAGYSSLGPHCVSILNVIILNFLNFTHSSQPNTNVTFSEIFSKLKTALLQTSQIFYPSM